MTNQNLKLKKAIKMEISNAEEIKAVLYTSETVNELFSALSKSQSELGPLVKDETNKAWDKKYSSLSSVIHTVRGPLTNNGLCLSQWITGDYLISMLGHSSGQWMQSAKRIIVKDITNPQSEGSGITYARRYSIMSILGLAPEDDDGNSASAIPKISDALEKLLEADVLKHLENIWKKHQKDWRKQFKKADMDQIIALKEYLKTKLPSVQREVDEIDPREYEDPADVKTDIKDDIPFQ